MTRSEKILEARRLRALGWTAPAIGRKLGVSDSTIRNWYLGGVCDGCGTPLEGSRGKKAKRCLPCQGAWRTATAPWTREAVIDAIRRWADKHGRPPKASDWIRCGEGHPARTSIYRSHPRSRAAFTSWAEAIEAAGFPRPRNGYYVHTPEIRARQKAAQLLRRERERQAA